MDGHRKVGLPTDHLKINKYSGPEDPSFQYVYPIIGKMAQNAVEIVEQRLSPKVIVQDNSSVPQDSLECIQSMFLTNPPDDLAEIKRSKGNRVEGTCEWLLVQKEYTTWLVGDSPQLLRLVGGPGIGKTMISTFLVDELEKRARRSPSMTFAYYFCDNKDEKRNTATAIVRGLLLQLLRQHPNLFKYIQPDFDLMKGRLFDNFGTLWRILLEVLRGFKAGEIYLLVDALDECEKSTRKALLICLAELLSQTGGIANVKLLITCRPEDDIEKHLFDINGYLRIDSAKVNADLSKFIRVRVDDLSRKGRYSNVLKEKVLDALISNAGGTFLWASLVIVDLEGCFTYEVEEKLQSLPKDLYDVYDRILRKIETGRHKVAKFVLRCTAIARRPLTEYELATAYILELGAWKKSTIPQKDDLSELRDVFRSCEPLVYLSSENNTVNLVHQSVKDYLLGDYLQKNESLFQYHVVTDTTNLLMFQICWRYLSMEEFNRGNKIISRGPYNLLQQRNLPEEYLQACYFLLYASQEWQEHAVAAGLALVTDYEFKKDTLDKVPTLRDSWLLRAAEEGQEAVVRLLLEKGAELDSKDGSGRTPLWWAAVRGHEAVMRLLLEKGAELDSKDMLGLTSLSLAAGSGHEAVVRLLLEKGAELDSEDWSGQTPLSRAAGSGHEAVVRLLLEKGTELDLKDETDRTPLSWAAWSGHEAVVRLLLEKGADLDSKDGLGQTALSRAAGSGHEAVVRLLLEKGAELDSEDWSGQTPLSRAAGSGHEAVVRLLLEKGTELDLKDETDRTPLSWAAWSGHEAVVRLLLEKGADLDSKDGLGQTALSRAAGSGHEAVVRLLLEKGAELDSKDRYSQTALSRAAESGHEAVVRLLLEKGAELDSKDRYSQTALSRAAGSGHEAVVGLLLEKGAELDSKDGSGRTPLWWAAVRGHEAVVRLLLEKGAELDSKDWESRTPLSRAAGSGHEAVVGLLLEKGAELDSKDRYSQTALSWAAGSGHEAVVRLLLEKGAELDSKDWESQTPLSWAAGSGHEAVVRLLLEKGAELESKDNRGQTALSWAAENGNEAVVKLLLAMERVDPDSKCNGGWTPLSLAAVKGHKAVVELLLAQGRVNPDSKSNSGWTPLSLAARQGYSDVMRLLLEKYEENGVVVCDKDMDFATHPEAEGRITCDNCLSIIPDVGTHYHCKICNNGDFDICHNCIANQAFCLDGSHKLIKRMVKDRTLVDVTD